MQYQTPKPTSKNRVNADMASHERKYKDQTRTLSRFFSEHVKDCWNLAEITPAELLVLQENNAKKPMTSLIVLEIRR